MSVVRNYILFWVSAITLIGYTAFYMVFGFYYPKFGADFAALIGLAFMAAATTPMAVKAILKGARTDSDRFIISYWSIWAVTLVHRLWIIYLGMQNTPDNQVYYHAARESIVSGLIAIFIGISALHGAAAPFSGEASLQKRDIIIFSAAAGFSGIIAGMAIGVFVIAGWSN